MVTDSAPSQHPTSPADATSPSEDEAGRTPALHLPLIEAAEDAVEAQALEHRPSWRGWLHAATAPIALALGIVLICLASTTEGKVGSAVFMTTSLLLFGISATYHRFRWKPKTKVILKRLDHANIFLLIAGSCTPMALLGLPEDKGIILLSIVWGGALLGIAFRVFWIHAPRWLYVPLYIALGWAAVVFLPDLWASNAPTVILIGAGGLFYTVGAVFYGLKRPNFSPDHFGFHELFHACTVAAFFCHWAGILLLAIK